MNASLLRGPVQRAVAFLHGLSQTGRCVPHVGGGSQHPLDGSATRSIAGHAGLDGDVVFQQVKGFLILWAFDQDILYKLYRRKSLIASAALRP